MISLTASRKNIVINSYHWQGRGLLTWKGFHKSAIFSPDFTSVVFVWGFFPQKKADKAEGNVRSCTWQDCRSGGFLQATTNEYSGNIDELWGFWIPFCLFPSTLYPPLWTPISHFSVSHWYWIFHRRSCFLNCLEGKFYSLSAYYISHPENSKCIWKVSVKGFNHPSKPLSAAFEDYPLCGGGFWQWPGNMRAEPASAAGSPSWHSGRLSQPPHPSIAEALRSPLKKSRVLLENAD